MSTIVMIIAPENFRDEEYFEPKQVFESAGYTVVTASAKTGNIQGSHGGTAVADILLQDVRASDFATVVFVGGSGSYVYDNDTDAHRIAKEFSKAGKLVNAICHAPIIVAKAGLLSGKNATVHSGDKDELVALGTHYTGESVKKDGNIITADGPHSATEFGEYIVQTLAKEQ